MAISSATAGDRLSSVTQFLPGWVGQYLRDHAIHALVVAVLLTYPGVWHYIDGPEIVTLGKLVFPSLRLMLALFALGLFAISFDFISGYTGYLSFGHSMFWGLGLFTIIGVTNGDLSGIPPFSFIPADLPFMMLLIVAGLISAIVALLIGAVSFRLTGVYFAMITLGFAELLKLVAEDLFGRTGASAQLSSPEIGVPYVDALSLPAGDTALQGAQGIFAARPGAEEAKPIFVGDIPIVGQLLDLLNLIPGLNAWIVADPQLTGVPLTYYLIGGVVLVSYLIMQRIIHSPFGRVMIAIRENEERAAAIGYNTFIFKMGAFAISAFFASVAGSLYVVTNQTAQAGVEFSVIVRAGGALLATIIGGIGTLAGPFFGYLFDLKIRALFGERGSNGLENFLKDNYPGLLDTELPGFTLQEALDVWIVGSSGLYIGLVFIVFVLFVPGGLLGTLRLALGGKVAKQFPDWVSRRVDSVRTRISS